jgi:hypothetical protein
MLKYKKIMYVLSMRFDYVHISYTHDLPHFPCYSMHTMLTCNWGVIYTLTKPKWQAQCFLLAKINPHTHMQFCFNSGLSFLAYSLLATWLLIMHSFLLFSNLKNKLARLWEFVLNVNAICCCVKVVLAHWCTILEVVMWNLTMWEVVGHIMVALWNKECETYTNLLWWCHNMLPYN